MRQMFLPHLHIIGNKLNEKFTFDHSLFLKQPRRRCLEISFLFFLCRLHATKNRVKMVAFVGQYLHLLDTSATVHPDTEASTVKLVSSRNPR